MKNVVELLGELPFRAKIKNDIVANNKYSEVEEIYKGEEVIITDIDIEVSLAWWYKVEKVIIQGLVERTAVSDGYNPPTIEEQYNSQMFTERSYGFMLILQDIEDIERILEML
jgi:hypothetical protein